MASDPDHKALILPHVQRLLSSREYPKTICPSEVPRALTGSELKAAGVSDWRALMPEVREILWEMRQRGEVEILQKGLPMTNILALEDIKGPIRARRIL